MSQEHEHRAGTGALECTRFHRFDADCLSKQIGGLAVEQRLLGCGSYTGCVTTLRGRDSLFTVMECNQPFVCSGSSIPGRWNLSMLLAGQGDVIANGTILPPLHSKILSPVAEIHFRTAPQTVFTGFFVKTELLQQRLGHLGAPELDESRLDAVYQPVSSALPVYVRRMRDIRELSTSGVPLMHRQAECMLHDLLNDAILSSLYGAQEKCLSIPPACCRRYRLLRQLEDYVEYHSNRPLHLEELTAELNVSERTLEYICRDLIGTSTYGYMLKLRLNGVYRQLSSQPNSSIKEVALNWGFTHFPRFAQHYQRLFGELPHQTRSRTKRLKPVLR